MKPQSNLAGWTSWLIARPIFYLRAWFRQRRKSGTLRWTLTCERLFFARRQRGRFLGERAGRLSISQTPAGWWAGPPTLRTRDRKPESLCLREFWQKRWRRKGV